MSIASAWHRFVEFQTEPEQHNIDKMKLWGTGQDIGEPVHAGVFVSQASALRLTVVWRCIRLISETLAAMPADIVRKVGDIREPVLRPPRWIETPNRETNWYEFHERVCESLLMDGNSFVVITARDALGFPSEIWTLNPTSVEVKRRGTGAIYFLVNGSTEYSMFGPSDPLGDVLHIKLATGGGMRGMSPIEAARQAIGLGLVAEKFGAKFYGQGQQMSGVIQLPADQGVRSKEHIETIREQWEGSHAGSDRAHRPAILTGGATWQGITIPPDQAQFLDTRGFQVEEIARLYGVPPHMVASVEKSTSWGTGIEQQALGFLKFTLLPHIVRLETAFSSLLPRGQFVRLNQRGLLRADSATETEVLAKQVLNGIRSRNEVRALLDEPPVPGGDRFLLPLNEQILTPAGVTEPAPEPPTAPPPANNGQAALFGGDNGDKRVRELR